MITVKDLIKHLETFDQDLPVIYDLHSESKLMELEEVQIRKEQPPRADGWVHSKWPGKPELNTIKYCSFPGN